MVSKRRRSRLSRSILEELIRQFVAGTMARVATSISHDAMGHGGEKMEDMMAQNTIKLALAPAAPFEAGKTTQVTVKLSAVTDAKPLTFDDFTRA